MSTSLIILVTVAITGFLSLYFMFRKSEHNKYSYGFMGKKIATFLLVLIIGSFSLTDGYVLKKSIFDNRTLADNSWVFDIDVMTIEEKKNIFVAVFQNDKPISDKLNIKIKVFYDEELLFENLEKVQKVNKLSIPNTTNFNKIIIEIYDADKLVETFEQIGNY
ncbi:hypothetical protein IPJ91_02320 [bacterium]|nr:MAG: hypothetical protein IPJ91_02320 [bacterium]